MAPSARSGGARMPRKSAAIAALAWLAAGPARAGDASSSPTAGSSQPANLYWGDTHLHTSFSADANLQGTTRLTPKDAYEFARGRPVVADDGMTAKIDRPLDFLVVSDHSEYLGLLRKLRAGDPGLLEQPPAKRWYEMIQAG